MTDPCVVDAEPLSRLVSEFIDAWERTRPPNAAGRHASRGGRTIGFVSAITWLAAESGLPRRTVAEVRRREVVQVELQVADALVAAIGRPELLHDGTIPVRPRNGDAECCGGSMRFPPWSLNGLD